MEAWAYSLGVAGGLAVGAAVAAFLTRNLVYFALCLGVSFVAVGVLYLQMGAEFVGWLQWLVYAGAVSILIVFAIVLTRGVEPKPQAIVVQSPFLGGLIAVCVTALLAVSVGSWAEPGQRGSGTGAGAAAGRVTESPAIFENRVVVKQLGRRWVSEDVVAFEALGVLLTAALMGAAVLALDDRRGAGGEP